MLVVDVIVSDRVSAAGLKVSSKVAMLNAIQEQVERGRYCGARIESAAQNEIVLIQSNRHIHPSSDAYIVATRSARMSRKIVRHRVRVG